MRLIGYGYAPPTRNFRWCTDRLKIKPTNKILRDLVAEHDGVLVLTGSRFAESAARAASLRKHTAVAPINPHRTIKGAWMWSPIRHVTDEDLWEYLGLTPTPWGGHHRELQNFYKQANSGECPLVLDETSQPCGNSRMGCWMCTVVTRDRSMEGFIGSGHDEYQPMADFRDWLIELREDVDRTYRMPVRRNGEPGNGPLHLHVREQVLTRLLAIQAELGQPLISPGRGRADQADLDQRAAQRPHRHRRLRTRRARRRRPTRPACSAARRCDGNPASAAPGMSGRRAAIPVLTPHPQAGRIAHSPGFRPDNTKWRNRHARPSVHP